MLRCKNTKCFANSGKGGREGNCCVISLVARCNENGKYDLKGCHSPISTQEDYKQLVKDNLAYTYTEVRVLAQIEESIQFDNRDIEDMLNDDSAQWINDTFGILALKYQEEDNRFFATL